MHVNKVVNESFFAYKIGENGFEIADDGKFSVLFGENKKKGKRFTSETAKKLGFTV